MDDALFRDWPKHSRTGRKTICIVGMATTNRHLAPFDDPEVLIVGINEAYAPRNKNPQGEQYMKRWDAWLQLHPAWDCLRTYNFNHPNHPAWLRNRPDACRVCENLPESQQAKCEDCGGTTIYTPNRPTNRPIFVLDQDLAPMVPGAVMYPYYEIVEKFGLTEEEEWFSSSLDYGVLLGLHYGFGEVMLFGFEMTSGTEYQEQKPSAMYWLGMAAGLGVMVTIPPGCRLFRGGQPRYALDKVPGLYTPMHAEIARNGWKEKLDQKIGVVNNIRGQKKALLNQLKVGGLGGTKKKKLATELTKLTEQEINHMLEMNAISGAFQQAERVYNELKGQTANVDLKILRPEIKLAALEGKTGDFVFQSDKK